ncbi:MAG: hypothetical protein A2Y77_03585 [Planctomycetes bacterium RBG_13_62_9]|nr:MAG: hypothetical protein A2Y77_03585 [Planctomycetes bacterium RBG_13_62_9]
MRATRQAIILLVFSITATSCVSHLSRATATDPGAMLKQARAEQAAAREAYADAIRETMPKEPAETWLDPADASIYEQLERTVDLSALRPEMPLGETIEAIRKSVQPPLNIVVLWRELYDNADIEPSTAINMDGLPNVKLGSALQSLLHALSNPQMQIQLDYVVQRGVITIATDVSLPAKTMISYAHEVPAVLRATGSADHLAMVIQQTIEPDSWLAMSERGQGVIVPGGSATLVVWQSPDVHRKIHDLLLAMAAQSPVVMPIGAPQETLKEQMQFLLSHRDTLEKEIIRLEEQEARSEAGSQTQQNVVGQLRMMLDNLDAVKQAMATKGGDPLIETLLAGVSNNVRECLAILRQTPCHSQAGSSNDTPMASSLAPTLWDLPLAQESAFSMQLRAKQAEQRDVSRRIAAIQDALIGRTTFDPEVRRIQAAAKRLQEADSRVQQLEMQLAGTRSNIVTVNSEPD